MSHLQKLFEYLKRVLVNNELCEKLISSLELPVKFDQRFRLSSIFIAEFELLSCELDNYTFNVLY